MLVTEQSRLPPSQLRENSDPPESTPGMVLVAILKEQQPSVSELQMSSDLLDQTSTGVISGSDGEPRLANSAVLLSDASKEGSEAAPRDAPRGNAWQHSNPYWLPQSTQGIL